MARLDCGDISEFLVELLFAGETHFAPGVGVEPWVMIEESDTNGYLVRDDAGRESRKGDPAYLLAHVAILRYHLGRGDFTPAPDTDDQRAFAEGDLADALRGTWSAWTDKAFLDSLLRLPLRITVEGVRRNAAGQVDYLLHADV